MRTIQDLLDGDALREVQFELGPLVLLEDGDDIEEDVCSPLGLKNQVSLTLLQLQGEDLTIILVQHN